MNLSERLGDLYLRYRVWLWGGQAVLVFLVGFFMAWVLQATASKSTQTNQNAATESAVNESQLWTCSMHPQIRRNKPGKCPLCGMELVQVKASVAGMRTVSISPAAQKLLQVETSPVERRYVTARVRMVGKIEYDETRLSHITAWVSGRLDRLYVDYVGIEVKPGDHMVYIYSEELYTAQEELIQAIKYRQQRPANSSTLIQPIDLVASSREKLRLLGLTVEQVAEIEQRGAPTDHITIYSPAGGIVIEKSKQEGDRVRTGDRIYTVADLSHLWVLLDAYESDLPWLRYGQRVEFSSDAYPGEVFQGQIAFIDPVLNENTRTVKIRVNIANDDGRLKPEMFVRATVLSRVAAEGRVLDPALAGKWISPMHPEIVKDEPGVCDVCGMPLVRAESLGYVTAEPSPAAKPLVIPVSAALVTGTRAIVYVQIPDAETPTYEGREIVLGPRAGDYYLVRNGLSEGELVVTKGNFKLDSALQISAKPSMMTPEGGGGGGHHHGDHATKNTDGMQASSRPKMALPTELIAQLHQLGTVIDSVTQAVEAGDLNRSRTAFQDVGNILDQLSTNAFPAESQPMWRELAMLLSNDVAEGVSAETLAGIDRAYSSLRQNGQRVKTHFQLDHEQHEAMPERIEVADDFRAQVQWLWQAYQPLGIALTSDDGSAAVQSAVQLRQTLAAIDASSLQGPAASTWQRESANLSTIITQLEQASDLKQLRVRFALLSDELISLFRLFGVTSDPPLYELHCNMAFQGRGASWLQDHNQPQNPYYGAAMLSCADRVQLLNPSNAEQGDAPSGHEH